jgi:integrase
VTLTDVFDAYLAETALEHVPSTHYQQTQFFRRVAANLGNPDLDMLTLDYLRAWKLRMGTRLAPSTLARYLGLLSATLRYAVANGWMRENPLTHLRRPKEPEPRTRFLSAEERHRLLTACRRSRSPLLYPLVVLALSTGGRKNELCRLRWPEVDFERRVVRFLRTKTKRPRSAPLLGEAHALLHRLFVARAAGVAWVFPNPTGLRPWNHQAAWITARRKADLQDFRFHDLRHTFASDMAMSGASLRDIAEVLGHARLNQTMRYAHLLPSHTESVVQRMLDRFET